MIRVGEKLLQRYGARLPMMAGPVLTAVAIG
jgi:DHA2 family multidrug resistance protein-like MFS transporter